MSAPGGSIHHRIGIVNTVHSEIASCLPLPSMPVFYGAVDNVLKLFDEPRPLNRSEVLAQAGRIADLLHDTDVSYLALREDAKPLQHNFTEYADLEDEVIRYNSQAFEYTAPGPLKEQINSIADSEKVYIQQKTASREVQSEVGSHSHQSDNISLNESFISRSKKTKLRKKETSGVSSTETIPPELQEDAVIASSEILEDFCTRTEIPSDDRDEIEWLSVPVSDLRSLVNDIMAIRSKRVLHLVPVEILARLLTILDHQVHQAEGLSIDDCEHSDSDAVSTIFCALESIHAVLAVMTNYGMPKQIYKEEVIERILEFSRHQLVEVMSACDPSYRALHKPHVIGAVDGDDDGEADPESGCPVKRGRPPKNHKFKKAGVNRVSSSSNAVLQKLCTILGFLRDLLSVEHLSDSCVLQLLKSSFSTFLVDNIHLLQLKSISLISMIFSSYKDHRVYVIDEVVRILWKLSPSKRALRAYLLPDEDQRQIQMVTGLLIQLVQCGADLPEPLRKVCSVNALLEPPTDANCLAKCHDTVTETCCLFWSRVLQRFTSAKSQDASEMKLVMENVVMDLLTALNLPEYPASAPILEVLCVLLLQNAGLQTKDVFVRSVAIDILGTIAARLKTDSVVCSREFWINRELVDEETVDHSCPKDACVICFRGKNQGLFHTCNGCRRLFHDECMGVADREVPNGVWECVFCQSRKQLLLLQEYRRTQQKDGEQANSSEIRRNFEAVDVIEKHEVVQQLLLNYLQEAATPEDAHLFAHWFYLCLWYKDDPKSEQKFSFYIARMKSKVILGEMGTISSLGRDFAKKITLSLGQNSSFARGFDKILFLLLASLREGSPVIRAKALRAVSIIVEADPEVLGEKRVQLAVEGRFCDSAISVREAALELVGRHIASHPDVGLKYFDKVSERVKDTGVSVRKRAIRIIRDMCNSNVKFSEHTRAFIEIITRVNDDEASIQDLVCKTFYEFWFEEVPGSRIQFSGDGSSVPLDVAKNTEQMVEMLKKMPNPQLIVTVIKRSLALDFFSQSAKAAGISTASLASVRKRCELMCKCLLERILQVEETAGEEVEVPSLPYVSALHVFSLVDPTLCAPASDPSQFLVTLQPYLKTQVDDRTVSKFLKSVIFLIDAVLPFQRKLPRSVVEELEEDLKHMIVRHPFLTVVHTCIKCLCSVSRIAGKGPGVVEYLIQVFFKRVGSLEMGSKQKLGRSLFCLGMLIRYGNPLLCAYYGGGGGGGGGGGSLKNLYVESSLDLFKKYLQSDDFVTKIRAFQAFGFVLITKPEYMFEKEVRKIIEAMLSSDSDPRIKLQALQNMHEYLLEAEGQMEAEKNSENGAGHYLVRSGRKVPVAAGAGDSNICGGIVQLYWDRVLDRCLDVSDQVRHSALKIVEVVQRQGLVHPITCVPSLIALETDTREDNSKLAHCLLANMNEKYPAFFESRLGDGLQLSFSFVQALSGGARFEHTKQRAALSKPGGLSAVARLGISRIYRLIRGNRVSRNKFISSVVRKFDSSVSKSSAVPFLVYCAEILALLPFTTSDEPLYMVFAINRVIQVRAGLLEANMKALSSDLLQNGMAHMRQLHGRAPPPDRDVGPTAEDGPCGREDGSSDGSKNSGSCLTDSPDLCQIPHHTLLQIQAECRQATALQLLMSLKRHLKAVYSLSDVRCQAFSPSEPVKAGETLTRQSVQLDIQGTPDCPPTTYEDFAQRCQDFKAALREDVMDFSTYTSSVKRRRVPPRRGGRPNDDGPVADVADAGESGSDGEWVDEGQRGGRRRGAGRACRQRV